MKTRRDLFQRLSDVVKTLHSYEVPEILAVPAVEGSTILGLLATCYYDAQILTPGFIFSSLRIEE
jgi:hypothetical protein